MEKRYQVFVSSTFRDLQEERQEIIQALLELNCVPSGMELFPAANEDQWTLIKQVIDDCDYYIVIIAGRYGSLGPDGISYTEMEYRYALEQGIPTIGFLHKNPNLIAKGLSESNPEYQKRLEDFRALVEQKMCRFWENPTDLGSKVSRSVIRLINTTPAVGWIRADQAGELASPEILRLRTKIEELEASIQASRETAPPGTEALAQGDDKFKVNFTILSETPIPNSFIERTEENIYNSSFSPSWNDIFSNVAPLMIDEAKETTLKSALSRFITDYNLQRATKLLKQPGEQILKMTVADRDFQTIKVQLRALGLIAKSQRPRSVKDTGTYWSLTPYGDSVMTRLRAIPRQ
jgi:hypothetical protein